jgi:hypothetical protein
MSLVITWRGAMFRRPERERLSAVKVSAPVDVMIKTEENDTIKKARAKWPCLTGAKSLSIWQILL